MRSVEEALEAVGLACPATAPRAEHVPLAEALGRTLASDVRMDHDVPPFRRAAMDGFALRRADAVAGATLRVVATVAAGEWPDRPVGAGEAVRVMTGAPVPPGADAVLPVEVARAEGATVRVEVPPGPASHVVEPGEHRRAGEVVLARGHAIRPGDLAVLATAGCATVPVARRPRVAVLGTGSELVDPAARPGPGRIRDSNSFALLGQAAAHGAEPVPLGTVGDVMEALGRAIRRGLEADLLVLSGGVSRGDLDLVPAALAGAGVREVFHRWRVQPGGPLWFGTAGPCLVFGLPGNPAASFVGFEVLAVPALRAMLGRPFGPRPTFRARYEGPWGPAGDRRRYRPVRLASDADATLRAVAVPWKGSGDPFGVARGDALAVLREGEAPPAGRPALVDAIPLGPLEPLGPPGVPA